MALKKSQLYSSLWFSCDELRGGMDASQYKDYVLFMLFIKYVSDKYADSDDFAPPVTIPEGASFTDMVKLKGKSDIGDKINTQIIRPLIDNNSRLAHSDFPDFNDPDKLGEGKAMVDRLTNLISIFQRPELDFSKNRADHDDILGDAYEYLMRHFATESGKSKGQFYTPSEVSRVIAQVIGISPDTAVASTTAYDPTCGSGSLLLKVAAQAGKHITLEGQEKDQTTAGLARMNMILHDFPTANVLQGNTLASPKFKDGEQLRTYDYVVANPPFSDKTWSNGITPSADPYQRFAWGSPPGKQGDYAYLLHIIRSMKSNGKAACILPHGVLFRGNAEAVIRKKLVRSGYLKGIIGLPANLFYGTGIPACILVLDKENANARKGIFMVDASKGFIKDGSKNRLREQDIHRIVDTFNRQADTPRYARMVPFEEIDDPRNDYNLNLPRYIDSTEPENIQDIDGHLRGGIPERDIDDLDIYWKVIPGVREVLFEDAVRPGYCQLRLPITEVKAAILKHDEFDAFKATVTDIFDKWRSANVKRLKGFDQEGKPKELIATIAEDLLAAFKTAPLLNSYDMYQHLMDYWAATMQDDCYLIAADGWTAETHRVLEEVKSGKKKGEMKDKGWACDLIPKPYIVARYFAKEQVELDALQAELDDASASLTELAEEHGGDEGALKDVSTKGDAQKAYNQALVAVWNEEDKVACDKYNTLINGTEEYAVELRNLTDHHHISILKNSKGNLTLKAIRDRLASTGDKIEQKTLIKYLDVDKQQKAKTKEAAELLTEVGMRYRERLNADPLPEELADLQVTVCYLDLLDKQSVLKSKVKDADTVLNQLVYDKYPTLSVKEIKTLVVDDKWLSALAAAVQGELNRVSQTLTGRIRQLAERYETPLSQLTDLVTDLSTRVDKHLARMRAVWN
ncbi:MAG: N-6 DNA methylase [Candidatus Dadabacteria bacterium]|nr:N-6 DNA methylase [Candidatus Dadabacteria bacterium]MDE0476794.1 N-6 DNA methylase [Candidatus Dadabacteria bacterium]